MKVNIEKTNNDWRLILIPEDEIEGAILKQKNGNVATHVSDMKSHGTHIPDCLVISGTKENTEMGSNIKDPK